MSLILMATFVVLLRTDGVSDPRTRGDASLSARVRTRRGRVEGRRPAGTHRQVCQIPVRETAPVTTTALEDLARHPEPPLWRTPGLAVLFTASTTARLANESARVALVLLVLDRTGSPALAGALVAALTLPALVTGPLLGAWLDRTSHRRAAFV